jgi:hypothetical protein
MRLHAPFEIGSRLLPELKIGDGRVSLEPTRRADRYGKRVWRWYIDTPAGDFSDADLCGHGNTREMFAALLTFLSACAESYRGWLQSGEKFENFGLFPEEVAEWAYHNHDEIDMTLADLETPGLIEEDS